MKDKCCGSCCRFMFQDTDGLGYCAHNDREMCCSEGKDCPYYTKETVLDGWVVRDNRRIHPDLWTAKPERDMEYCYWYTTEGEYIDLPDTAFPDITWDDEPLPVTVTITPKQI